MIFAGKKVALINYGCGNIFSLKSFFLNLGCEVIISQDFSNLYDVEIIILPGVGSYSYAINQIKSKSSIDALKNIIMKRDKLIICICLGMQILFSSSDESPEEEGINIFNGNFKEFREKESKSKLTNIGFSRIKSNNICDLDMYFVHSYFLPIETDMPNGSVLIKSEFNNQEFIAGFVYKNIIATQFHPEKSQINGVDFFKKVIPIISNV